MFRSGAVQRTGFALALGLAASWSCTEKVPGTEILLVIDSNLVVGSELTEIHLRLLDRQGREELRFVPLSLISQGGQPGRYTLPLSLSLAAEHQDSTRDFRVYVTGRGPLGPAGETVDVVEQIAIVSFRPNARLRLDIFLGADCLNILCRDGDGLHGDLACDPVTGTCESIPERTNLPRAMGDGIDQFTVPEGVMRERARDAEARDDGGSDAECGDFCDGGAAPPECSSEIPCQDGFVCRADHCVFVPPERVPSAAAQTCGGGSATSAGYRMQLSVGGLQPIGSARSARYRVHLGSPLLLR